MAERNGAALRRLLRSADRFKDAAMRLGSRDANTPWSRVNASLCSVTWRDHRRPVRECDVPPLDLLLRLWLAALRRRLLRWADAAAFRVIAFVSWHCFRVLASLSCPGITRNDSSM